MKYVVFGLAIVIAVIFTIFGLENPAPVDVRFLGLQTGQFPLYGIVLLSGLAGMLLVGLVEIPGRIQSRLESRRMRQQISDLQTQVADLKSRLPAPVMQPLPEDLKAMASRTPQR